MSYILHSTQIKKKQNAYNDTDFLYKIYNLLLFVIKLNVKIFNLIYLFSCW